MNLYNVASPCINICKIEETTQRCIGCDRTIDEITRWSGMEDEAKQAVIDAILQRKKSQQTPTTPGNLSKSESTTPGAPGNRSTGCE